MEANSSRFSGPTPEVVYIPALFRRIQQGDIRVPAFQRGLVWTEDKVVDLLKSIYQGFPVGSLLFWRVQDGVLKVETPRFSVFPVIEEKYPCNFILDGLQRLSSLYAVFHFKPDIHPPMFRVFFNLDTNLFESFGGDEFPERSVPLAKLFSPKEFIEIQRHLNTFPDADTLLEKAVDLHSRFQEYLIPTVTIAGRSPADVVQVFERINTTATTLNAVDFMRAVTWSESFDLNAEISGIAEPLSEQGFPIPPETVVKILAVTLGKEPTPESMLELRTSSSLDLHEGVNRSREALQKSIQFLNASYFITSYDFVPYEGQLLALTRFFELCQSPTLPQLEALRRWYWTISFNEGLRGKPDHYVTRILHRVVKLASGDLEALKTRLTITAADFIDRRFIKGKALSSAIATMFSVQRARSLITGKVISPIDYMTEFVAKNFQPLLSSNELASEERSMTSNKLLANTVLVASNEVGDIRSSSPAELISVIRKNFVDEFESICESQFITADAYIALERGQFADFIQIRAQTMFSAALKLASGGPA